MLQILNLLADQVWLYVADHNSDVQGECMSDQDDLPTNEENLQLHRHLVCNELSFTFPMPDICTTVRDSSCSILMLDREGDGQGDLYGGGVPH